MAGTDALEQLEARRLLSAVLSLNTLRINGANGVNDAIAISMDPLGTKIQVVINGGAGQLFDPVGVKKIIVNSASGNDDITIDDAVGKPTWVYAGDGFDRVTCGGEADYINSGAGDDTIDAGDGRNQVLTGAGDDSITAGGGSDRILCGSGNDIVEAGDGSNTVQGEAGNDSIAGGGDDDLFYGGTGSDTLVGRDGDDTLLGNAGNDSLNGGDGSDVLGALHGTDTLIGGKGGDFFGTRSITRHKKYDFKADQDVIDQFSSHGFAFPGD